jgi:hypothetical protein
MNTLSAELSKIRYELETMQEDHIATAMPEGVKTKIEELLVRLAELTGALREANL